MTPPRFSTTIVGIVLAVVALGFYGLIVLYGAWLDGRRQKIRDKGKHPVTEGSGEVHAREDEVQEHRNGSRRDG
ncbi:MAG TPA: hypothetical protein VMD97_00305 [Candidatus Aquilonibacter sp.]|nr:hypothetical protein [Candidatus Aquilonibacter sp.]